MIGELGEGVLPRVVKTYIDMAVSRRTADIGISPSCCILLRTIYYKEGSTLQELSEYMMVNKSLITRNVKQLIDAGLVENRSPLKNRNSLFLTEDGKIAAEKIIRIVNEVFDEMMAGFTDMEKNNLRDYFKRISINLQKMENE